MAIPKKDDFVKVVLPNGDHRYGWVANVTHHGMEIHIYCYDEGLSKIAFDEESALIAGLPERDWETYLTAAEKRLVPLVADLMTTEGIASELGLSSSTIRAQTRTLRTKLDLDDRIQLIYYCQGLRKTLNGNQ